jgi:hypothetical protein
MLSPLLYFTKLLLRPRLTTQAPPKPSHRPEEHFPEGPSKLELEVKDEETNKKHQQRGWDTNDPEDPLSLVHCTNIIGIHAQDTRDKCQGKEDDSDCGENIDSFGVAFSMDFDRLLSLS